MKEKPVVHLICNAHLDPVWLWEWEEGAAEAISTFRVAAELCEKFDGFVFNHNEAILYEWVEDYEPELFARIQRLVKEGKWHIMGGWYLQPDCNMPSGESFVRQILIGQRYFKEKFAVSPTTAINFDPFGHTQGLVQILAKSGYDSYLFCRPGTADFTLPREEFIWQGYDGSQILATRTPTYNSPYGKAVEKIEDFIKQNPKITTGVVAWGVGNHGGGPSKIDLQRISELITQRSNIQISHSTPEKYFAKLSNERDDLLVHDNDINAWAVGCYTSQIRLKQKHRQLENELYKTEKMLSNLWLQGITEYPKSKLDEAIKDLCHAEFHDILPGSSIERVEETSLRLMDHGLETLSRLKAKAFFALAAGQPKAAENSIPILIYNPHPYKISGLFECEFQLADQNWEDNFTTCLVKQNCKALPTQIEQEASYLNLDWRKKVVFEATLEASQMNRFDCDLIKVPERPQPTLKASNGHFEIDNGQLKVVINSRTGLMDLYEVDGKKILNSKAFRPLVMADNEDPWGMLTRKFRSKTGYFKLMTAKESAIHSGINSDSIAAVRVIEQGAVRTVIEASFRYHDSFMLITYRIPNTGTELEVEVRVTWNEKDKMLKLSLPLGFTLDKAFTQTAYGFHALPTDGNETITQKWITMHSESTTDRALQVIDDGIYGCDVKNSELRLSLLRSPAYSGHPIMDQEIVPQDRFTARSDQGERVFRFWVDGGPIAETSENVERNALTKNEKPIALSFFPNGHGRPLRPGPALNGDPTIVISACKKAEDDDTLIIRLYNASATAAKTGLIMAGSGIRKKTIKFSPFEVKTFSINKHQKKMTECDMMEYNLK